MTLSGETDSVSLACAKSRRIVVMARHGERKDYVEKEAGNKWIPTTNKPWDPPLTEHGLNQSRRMGRAIQQTLKDLNLPPISAVYSSPLQRCRQTALAAIDGLSEQHSLRVCIENGLMESANATWYGSWCFDGSDSTWGYRPRKPDGSIMHLHEIDVSTVHEAAKKTVQQILDKNVLLEDCDLSIEAVDTSYESISQVPAPYCWGNFETRQQQRERMKTTMELLAKNDESILCVSHGGPVTHLYEQLTGNDWTCHGESSYTCISIYVQENGGEWQPLLVNDSKHLEWRV